MSTIKLGIIGLRQIGASAALALLRYNQRKDAAQKFVISAYDPSAAVVEAAGRQGLKEVLVRDFDQAARAQDIVLLALRYGDVQTAYQELARSLRPGAVLLDASPLKQPSLTWAQRLPEGVHMVGITPVVNPAYIADESDVLAGARPDLFEKADLLITPAVKTTPDAIELAADWARILGARPRFLDPAEHDGLAAQTEGLPILLGIAAFFASARADAWSDVARFTNPSFGRLTRPLGDHTPEDLGELLLNNRENLVRKMDDFSATLGAIRDALAQGDQDTMHGLLRQLDLQYHEWLGRRQKADWGDQPESAPPAATGGILGALMGDYLSKRLSGKGSKD